VLPAAAAGNGTNNFLVSVNSSGAQGNDYSFTSAISSDGHAVLFTSVATNLVPGDTNGRRDLFVRDRTAGTTTRATLTGSGGQIDNDVNDGAGDLSADGTRVVFSTPAKNVVPNDAEGDFDVFVRDLHSATRTLMSVAPDGRPGATWHERSLTWRPADSDWPALSPDGRFVAFLSDASNLLSSDPAHQLFAGDQIYVRDLATGKNSLASVGGSGQPARCVTCILVQGAPSVSAGGRFVVFQSDAENLVPGDTNGGTDYFLRDLVAGTTERVNVTSSETQSAGEGIQARPAISPNGRYVVFSSTASDLVQGDTNEMMDIFLRDRVAGTTERVSLSNRGRESKKQKQGGNGSFSPAVSADGRFVSFVSLSNDLVDNDTGFAEDVFVRDRTRGTTERITIPTGGGTPVRGYGTAGQRALSADGRFVALTSDRIGPGDATNEIKDAYLHDRAIAARPTPVKTVAGVTLSILKQGRRLVSKGGIYAVCCGVHVAGKVAIRLFVYRPGARKFVPVERRTVPLDDEMRYATSFKRAKARRCRATARFLGNDFYGWSLAVKKFRC